MLALVYAFNAMAELRLSSIGLSMVSRIAAAKETDMTMGARFLCSAMGNWRAGKAIAADVGIGDYEGTFTFIVYADLGVGKAFLDFSLLISQLVHG